MFLTEFKESADWMFLFEKMKDICVDRGVKSSICTITIVLITIIIVLITITIVLITIIIILITIILL